MVILYKDGKIPVKVGSEMVSSYMESGYTKEPVEEKVSKEAPKKEVEQVVEEIAKSVSEEPNPSEEKKEEEEAVKTPYKKRSYSKRS
jgi:GTPase SAR1 family protein